MDKLYFAKVKEDAIIPTKRVEDAGYDFYACFEDDYMVIHSGETVMIPLGIATSFSSNYVMLLKERGSTGTKGLAQRCGVIDSGYRGEYLAPITNTNRFKSIIIAKSKYIEFLKTQKYEDGNDESTYDVLSKNSIFYPYEKAICQGLLLYLPQLEQEEISYEDLKNIKSERGVGKLGSSEK